MAGVIARDHAYPSGNAPGVSAASADPGGMTNTEKDAVAGVLAEDASKGAAVHAYDPDAPPAAKGKLTGAARAQLDALPLPRNKKKEADGGTALVLDNSAAGGAPAPTVTLKDIQAASQAQARGEDAGWGMDKTPGGAPAGGVPAVPDFIGWRQLAGLDSKADSQAKAAESIIQQYLTEQMYGAWYHNAGIIIFAVITTRFISSIGLGFAWVLIILAFCAAYYSLSIVRTRNRARDDIQRELVKTRLVTETESAEWLNHFLDRFWLIYEPILSQTIVNSVDSALAASTPGFVESIRLTTFTLGTKAPRIDYVRTFPKTPDDIVTMDWALSFTPNDMMDLTEREKLSRVNPKIVLSIRLGKGFVSTAMPILLEDMSFTGRMRIKAKLRPLFPHVSTIEMSFIEKPTFDYVLKPIGGEFGFDINNIPALAPFIRDQVHANLGPMMYDPNVFTIDLAALLSGTPSDSAIGVLEINVLAARNIKATKLGGGAPDPYVTIGLGGKEAVTRTKTIRSSSHPSWHEKHYILVNQLSNVLQLTMWDFNDRRNDSNLGMVTRELKTLEENASQDGIVGSIIHDGKERGTLRYDLQFYPVLKPAKGPDGVPEPLPNTNTGVVRVTIHQAKDLDISGEHGHISPYAQLRIGSTVAHKTKVLKRGRTYDWESSYEYLCQDKKASRVTVDILDDKSLARDTVLGTITMQLDELLAVKESGIDWIPLTKSRGGQIRLSAEWKPVEMPGSISGAHDYVPPIGVFRVWLKKAIDVKNVEGALGGKSDPYVRITGRNKVQARTLVQDNNLNPEWDEIVYFPVSNVKQHFVMELLDHQNIGKDRSLGYVEIKSKDYIRENDGEDSERYPYTRTEETRRERRDRIKLDKADSYKGTLVYEVDFCPAVSLRGGVHFKDEADKLDAGNATTGDGNDIVNGDAAQPAQGNGSKVSLVSNAVPAGINANGTGLTNGNGDAAKGHASRPSISGYSVASVATNDTAATAQTTGTVASRDGRGPATEAERDDRGVVMSKKDIMASKAGVLVFQLVEGELPRKSRLELYVDDAIYPAFISTKARSARQTFDEIGEGFVRELEFSRMNLRITSGGEDGVGQMRGDDILAEFACDTKDLLDSCLESTMDMVVASPTGSHKSKIKMAMRYLPIDISLEPREKISNMGILQVDVLSAHNLHAADRGGKSDPNITVTLNGSKVFKSETIKKTVNPEWNESFECVVRSRVAAKCEFEIHDWDRVGSATHLGRGLIDLAALKILEPQSITIPVVHDKLGEKGSLNLRIFFQPEIVSPEPERKGTFTTAGRVVGTVGGVPLAAGRLAGKGVLMGGGAVAHGVGRGVGTVGKGVGAVGGFAGRKIGLIKKKDKEGRDVLVSADQADLDVSSTSPMPTGMTGFTDGPGTEFLAGEQTRGPPPSEPGHLSVTVLGARGIKVEAGTKLKSYVAVKLGGKGHKTDHEKGLDPDWNETFTYNITPATNMLHIALHEHQLLGRDPVLAETEIDIWQYIDSYKTSDTADIPLPNGLGTIVLKLDWNVGTPSSSKLARKRSMSSIAAPSPAFANGVNADGASVHAGSPGRFSALRMSMGRKHAHDE